MESDQPDHKWVVRSEERSNSVPTPKTLDSPLEFYSSCYSLLKKAPYLLRKKIFLNHQHMQIRKMSGRKKIALVAHDNKKTELIEWAVYNKNALSKHRLFATGSTGKLLEQSLDQPVSKYLSGPLGGDQQIGAHIAEGKIDVLIFFWDPMEAQPHDPDIKALLRLGVVWNIPIACDRATADFMLTSPLMYEDYEVILPDYSQYVARSLKKKEA
jgi:methylglyoxal synthase